MHTKLISKFAILSLIALSLFAGCNSASKNQTPNPEKTEPVSKVEVYERPEKETAKSAEQLLIEGNKRFVENKVLNDNLSEEKRKDLVKNGQHPFAVVLTCSDSRVPPEILFDQGLGDLFVIRDAGNVVDPVELGSIEYGVEHLHSPLVVVLGHENCGAVKATVDGGEAPGSIKSIVERIRPSFDAVKTLSKLKDEIYDKCENENIKHSVADIEKSPIVKELEEKHEVQVVGAKYHLETGKVTFDNETTNNG